jgi:hypothetical protein
MSERESATTITRLERALGDIPGVRGARVQANGNDVRSVRVLVVPERHEPATAERVRSIASSSLGIDVSPQRIHLLSAPTIDDANRAGRRKLSSLTIDRTTDRFSARITLELGGDVLVGEAEGPAVTGAEMRTVAHAALNGVRELLEFPIELGPIEFLSVGDADIAVVALAGDGHLVGSAVVRRDRYEAVARATLDAVNRFVFRSE